jgi:uncharacterized protein
LKFFGLVAFAAMIIAVPVMAETRTSEQPVITGTRLELTARGEAKRVPDVAVISTGVVTQSVDAASVMRDNAARMARVLAALKRAGVADKDVTTSAINLMPQYRYNNNQPPVITGYQASNQVSVRFRDISRSGAILDALVKEGANEINGPSLTIDDPQAAQNEARVAAIKAARERATLYASTMGMKIKRIVSITESEGMSGGPVPLMMMKAGREAADTSVMPGEQNVGMSVTMVFELQ